MRGGMGCGILDVPYDFACTNNIYLYTNLFKRDSLILTWYMVLPWIMVMGACMVLYIDTIMRLQWCLSYACSIR